jgi:peptidoglycan/xylan/chitin deacetylase (PgdA/CDA1 family)
MRILARDAVAEASARTGWIAPAHRHRGRLVVITLHRVLPPTLRARYPFPGLAVTPGELSWMLATLKESYTLGPLGELHGRCASGEDLEKPFLAVTFDDGQRDNVEHALPILARHGVRASFFVPVDAIDRQRPLWHDELGFAVLAASEAKRADLAPLFRARRATPALAPALAEIAKGLTPEKRELLVRALSMRARAEVPSWAGMMSWDDVRALAAEGHEVGSHSMSHALLPQCGDRELEHEVARSKERIEGAIGRRVDSFCYPNGDCDRRVIDAVRRAGYRRAVTTRAGHNDPRSPALALFRHDIVTSRLRDRNGTLSAALLQLRLAS